MAADLGIEFVISDERRQSLIVEAKRLASEHLAAVVDVIHQAGFSATLAELTAFAARTYLDLFKSLVAGEYVRQEQRAYAAHSGPTH